MIHARRRFLVRLLGVLLLIVVTTATALGAAAYKITIRGPGLTDTVVVWLASDAQLLQTFNSNLSSEVTAPAPPTTAVVYDITWFFGPCWQTATPCTADPTEVMAHRTRYAFDTRSQQGALAHIDIPAWFSNPPKDSTTWYRTSTAFDRAIQEILAKNGATAALPETGSVPDVKWYLIMAGIMGIISGGLALWWYVCHYHRGSG